MFHCRSPWRTIQQYGNRECPEPSQMIITMKVIILNTGLFTWTNAITASVCIWRAIRSSNRLTEEPQKKQRIFLAKQCSSNEKSICAKPQIEHCLWINSLGSHLLLPLPPAPITPQTTRLDFVLFYLWLISVLSYYRMEEFNKIATSLAFYSAGNATIPDRMNGGMPADSYQMDGCLPF